MLTLFETTNTLHSGIVTHPEFSYLRDGLKRELRKFEQYYRRNAMVVRSSHLIVQMLQSLHVTPHYDPDTYVNIASDQVIPLAKMFKLTTPSTVGKLHSGVFYGSDVKEAIILTNTPLPLNTQYDAWQSLAAVTVVDHPYDSLGMWIPDGLKEIEGEGYAVIEINLPILALQYNLWRGWRQMDLVEDTAPAITQFVHRFVLPNMMRSHLDIAIINRTITHFKGELYSGEYPSHPFHVTKYDRQFDRLIEDQLQRLRKRRLSFPQLLMAIPTVTLNSAMTSLKLPKVAKTRQVDWALTLSRLRHLAWLLQMGKETDNYTNGQWTNKIRRGIRQLMNDRLIYNQLPRESALELQEFIDTELLPYL